MLLVNPALRATLLARPERRGARGAGADAQRRAAVDPRARAQGQRRRHRRNRDHRPQAAAPAGPRGPLPSLDAQAVRACWPCSSTSARSAASRRCARTSSPTSRTSCARRSPRCARPSRRSASRWSAIRPPPIASSTSSTGTRSASARSSRICSICRASNRRSTGPTWRRCRCAPSPSRSLSLLRPRSRRSRFDVANEIAGRPGRPRAPIARRSSRCSPTSSTTPSSTAARAPRFACVRIADDASTCLRVEIADTGPRHRAAPPAAPVRALLSRRQRPLARHGRHRTGPLDRQAPGRSDERDDRRREHRPAAAPPSGSRCRSSPPYRHQLKTAIQRISFLEPWVTAVRLLSHICYTPVSRPWQGACLDTCRPRKRTLRRSFSSWLTARQPPQLLRRCETCGEKRWRPLDGRSRQPRARRAAGERTPRRPAADATIAAACSWSSSSTAAADCPTGSIRAPACRWSSCAPRRSTAIRRAGVRYASSGLPAWRCRCAGTRAPSRRRRLLAARDRLPDQSSPRGPGASPARRSKTAAAAPSSSASGMPAPNAGASQLRCGFGAPPPERPTAPRSGAARRARRRVSKSWPDRNRLSPLARSSCRAKKETTRMFDFDVLESAKRPTVTTAARARRDRARAAHASPRRARHRRAARPGPHAAARGRRRGRHRGAAPARRAARRWWCRTIAPSASSPIATS